MAGQHRIESADVLVIGSGGAGLRAALAAKEAGADVIAIGRCLVGKAHTVMAEGGVNAALGHVDKEDNPVVHAADTLDGGKFINNPRMVQLFAESCPERIWELERWGCLFDRTEEGKVHQRPFGASTYRRTCHFADRTGLEIVQCLLAEARKHQIKTLDEIYITSLLTSGTGKTRRIAGATGIDFRKGEQVVFRAKAVILATGGFARIFRTTSNPGENYGIGTAIAYEAGAELMDMEMVQFHPTGMVWPDTAKGVLITEAVRGEGGLLKNSKGERFMERYDKVKMELSSRSTVAKAIYTEIQEGRGTEHKGVYLDISFKPAAYIRKRLATMVKQMHDFENLDITKHPMEVAPTAHYTMGGIKVEPESAMSSIPGLFAAGEVTAGLHGANRLGGNSLAELLVYGKVSGEAAAKYAAAAKQAQLDEKQLRRDEEKVMAPFKKGLSPATLQDEIRELMWNHCAIERDAAGLKTAIAELEAVKRKVPKVGIPGDLRYNMGWFDYMDLWSQVINAEACLRAALMREESRGAHTRKDFPKSSKDWLANIICQDRNGTMTLTKRKTPPITGEVLRWLESKGKSPQ